MHSVTVVVVVTAAFVASAVVGNGALCFLRQFGNQFKRRADVQLTRTSGLKMNTNKKKCDFNVM